MKLPKKNPRRLRPLVMTRGRSNGGATSESRLDLRQRDGQGEPRVPAMGPVLRVEFVVALEVQVPLLFADLEEPPGLRSDPPDLRLEVAEGSAVAAVAGELVVDIADQSGMERRR